GTPVRLGPIAHGNAGHVAGRNAGTRCYGRPAAWRSTTRRARSTSVGGRAAGPAARAAAHDHTLQRTRRAAGRHPGSAAGPRCHRRPGARVTNRAAWGSTVDVLEELELAAVH